MSSALSRLSCLLAGTGLALSMMAPGRFALAQEPRRLQLQLNWLETGDFSPLFAAELKQYDRAAGLQFVFAPGGPQVDAIQVIGGGGSPVGLIANMHQIILARASSVPVRMFAVSYQGTPTGVISRLDRPIRTAQDLVGKRIGLQAGARAAFALMIAAARINPDSVTIVPVGADPTPLVAGQVDGYWGTAVNQTITLRMLGVPNTILTMAGAGLPAYWQVYFATDRTINEQADSLVRMMQAAIRGGQYFKDNPDEIAAHIVKRSPQLNLNPAQVQEQCSGIATMMESPLTRQKGICWFDPADMKATMDLMVQLGQINAPINIADTYTTAILERAYGGRTML
jgi:ABC-type nitrate/sulfonate/bicarbonate transport system substrate-binding protein